jgi:hypothetical protein
MIDDQSFLIKYRQNHVKESEKMNFRQKQKSFITFFYFCLCLRFEVMLKKIFYLYTE